MRIIKKTVDPRYEYPVIDWSSLFAEGLFTKAQARRVGVEIESQPSAKYQGHGGYQMLYRATTAADASAIALELERLSAKSVAAPAVVHTAGGVDDLIAALKSHTPTHPTHPTQG